jgi:hypothetical protein
MKRLRFFVFLLVFTACHDANNSPINGSSSFTYDLLKSMDFQQPENFKKFLKDIGLLSMIGIQPETR